MNTQPLRIGIGGPVGSGKTALPLALCLLGLKSAGKAVSAPLRPAEEAAPARPLLWRVLVGLHFHLRLCIV